MERYEMAELLSKKAGVSLEEARQALAENEWDILDAMVALERRGKAVVETVTVDGTGDNTYSEPQQVKNTVKKEPVFTNGFAMIWHYICRIFRLSVDTSFTIVRREETLLSMPVLVLVVLLVVCFWVVLPLLVIGLFLGCTYRFDGKKGAEAANRAMDKIDSVVENIKETLDGDE